MAKNFFDEHYPQLTRMYYDYINSDEYAKHPLVNYTEPLTSRAIDEAEELLKQGKKVQSNDVMTECAITYEKSGFILGFTLAMQFVKESVVGKVAK